MSLVRTSITPNPRLTEGQTTWTCHLSDARCSTRCAVPRLNIPWKQIHSRTPPQKNENPCLVFMIDSPTDRAWEEKRVYWRPGQGSKFSSSTSQTNSAHPSNSEMVMGSWVSKGPKETCTYGAPFGALSTSAGDGWLRTDGYWLRMGIQATLIITSPMPQTQGGGRREIRPVTCRQERPNAQRLVG